MICSACGFDKNVDDAVCCGGCGKTISAVSAYNAASQCSVKLEVRCGKAAPNAPTYLYARVTNLEDTECRIAFNVQSQTLVELRGDHSQDIQLGSRNTISLRPTLFTATLGNHSIELELTVNNRTFYGYYELDVFEQKKQTFNVSGPIVQNNGDYMIGDHNPVIALPSGEETSSDQFVVIDMQSNRASHQIRKKPFRSDLPRQQSARRIQLRVEGGSTLRRIVLLGGTSQKLGRGKSDVVDLRLICPHREDPNEDRSEMISRQHATIEFTENGPVWLDQSARGTENLSSSGRLSHIAGESQVTLRSGMKLNPAGVLPLNVRLYEHQLPSTDFDDYESFTQRELPSDTHSTYTMRIGSVDAIRLERADSWSADEEYLLLQHTALIGSDDHCAIAIAEPGVGPHHAWIHFLGGAFWLEPTNSMFVVFANGKPIPLHQLIPLVPNIHIQVGEVKLTAHPYTQLSR